MYSNRGYVSKKPEATAMEIPEAPADTISGIAFNPENNAMAVSSWDGTLSLYRISLISGFGSTQPFKREKVLSLPVPALSLCFFGSHLVAGCADGSLVCFDASGNQTVVPAHSAGVKALKNYKNQFLVSGSFDSTLKFWDLKSMQPMHAITLPAKVYGMSLRDSLLCIALSNRTVCVYDMTNPSVPATFPTKFSYSIRAVDCGPDMDTLAVGSVDSRIEMISRSYDSRRFMIRAHRDTNNRLYAVNILQFCPLNGNIIVSGGADGNLVWFDKINKIKQSQSSYSSPVTAGEFSNDGRLFVFATGDDWSKGYTGSYVKPVLRVIESKNVPGIDK